MPGTVTAATISHDRTAVSVARSLPAARPPASSRNTVSRPDAPSRTSPIRSTAWLVRAETRNSVPDGTCNMPGGPEIVSPGSPRYTGYSSSMRRSVSMRGSSGTTTKVSEALPRSSSAQNRTVSSTGSILATASSPATARVSRRAGIPGRSCPRSTRDRLTAVMTTSKEPPRRTSPPGGSRRRGGGGGGKVTAHGRERVATPCEPDAGWSRNPASSTATTSPRPDNEKRRTRRRCR